MAVVARRFGTDPASVPQMTLDSGNAVTLYDVALPAPAAAIVLDPIFGSRFGTIVSLEGVNNKMPNQEIDDDSSILTVRLADDRYVPRSGAAGDSLAIGVEAVAGGDDSVALGAYSSSSGLDSTALSYGSVASG